jgi:hypothetical protein
MNTVSRTEALNLIVKGLEALTNISQGISAIADTLDEDSNVAAAENRDVQDNLDDLSLLQLKELAESLGLDPKQTKPKLIAAIKDAQAEESDDDSDEDEADDDSDTTAVTLSDVTGQLEDFNDEELSVILSDAKIKVKGKRSKLLAAITDGINDGAIDLSDYFEDEDDDSVEDDSEDEASTYNAEELVSDWSDKEIQELLSTNAVLFGKKAKRAELIDVLQNALDDNKIDLSEYEFEE